MNHPRPIDLKDPRIGARPSSARTGKKFVVGLLVVLIVSVMITWVGFLGWGVVEILRTMLTGIGSLWTKIF
jgi:hypothetical protein